MAKDYTPPNVKFSLGVGNLPSRRRTLGGPNEGAGLPGFEPVPVPGTAPRGLQALALGLGALGSGFGASPMYMQYIVGILQGDKQAKDDALRANADLMNQARFEGWKQTKAREKEARGAALEKELQDDRLKSARELQADRLAADAAKAAELTASERTAQNSRDLAGVGSMHDVGGMFESYLEKIDSKEVTPEPGGIYTFVNVEGAPIWKGTLTQMRAQLERAYDEVKDMGLSPDAMVTAGKRYRKALLAIENRMPTEATPKEKQTYRDRLRPERPEGMGDAQWKAKLATVDQRIEGAVTNAKNIKTARLELEEEATKLWELKEMIQNPDLPDERQRGMGALPRENRIILELRRLAKAGITIGRGEQTRRLKLNHPNPGWRGLGEEELMALDGLLRELDELDGQYLKSLRELSETFEDGSAILELGGK